MYTITKAFDFSAAHRIEGHPKCGRLHGHNYLVTITIRANRLTNGMVLDYGELSRVVKPLIANIDHRYIISNENLIAEDPYAELALEPDRDHGFLLDMPASTAECLARYFVEALQPQFQGTGEIEVTVSETPKTTATYKDNLHE